MPIKTMDATNVTINCSVCGTDDDKTIASLVLGNVAIKDAIVLPLCPTCSSEETLMRTWDTIDSEYSDSTFDLQRKAVNGLAKHLKDSSLTHATHTTAIEAEVSDSPDLGTYPSGVVPLP